MKNYGIKNPQTGKVVWISRSHAVVGILRYQDEDGKEFYLVQKRGPGCPDEIGKYAFSSGYLDYDETRFEALERELYEELGLDLKKCNYEVVKEFVNDDPKSDARQNVTTRYFIEFKPNDYFKDYLENLDKTDVEEETVKRGGEENEVSEIKLIPVEDIGNYQWAWNHKDLAKNWI